MNIINNLKEFLGVVSVEEHEALKSVNQRNLKDNQKLNGEIRDMKPKVAASNLVKELQDAGYILINLDNVDLAGAVSAMRKLPYSSSNPKLLKAALGVLKHKGVRVRIDENEMVQLDSCELKTEEKPKAKKKKK